MAELREAYERSLGRLGPIKERLRLTDALIDQIVYRLYGLTEEETRIAEGVVLGHIGSGMHCECERIVDSGR